MLREFIEIEAREQLWQAEIRHLHLWTTLRFYVLSAMIRRESNVEKNFADESLRTQLTPHIMSRHLRTLMRLYTATKEPQYDAVIFKKARNYSLYDAYYERIPKPLIIDRAWRGNITEHAWQTQDTLLMNSLVIASLLRRRTLRLTEIEKRTLRGWITQVVNAFDMASETEKLYRIARNTILNSVTMRHLLEQHILPQLKQSLAIVHQAYYLKDESVLTRTLREYGCTIAELQHGVIFPNHVAYNFPQSIQDDPQHPAHLYKPDVLLTFGDFWNQQISVLGATRTIGHPLLSDKLAHLKPSTHEKQTLVVSQGTFSEQLSTITASLARAYPDETFIYKLHPEEIDFPDRYTHLRAFANVKVIDYQAPIHDFIEQSATIFGAYSTVLFEAIAYPERRIFILDSDFLDAEIARQLGTLITSAEEITDIFRDETYGYPTLNAHDVWHPDWEANLNRFLQETIQ
ncbi:MAG: hypothetical protein AAFR81_26075 [Chloroflexota bacterium]